MSCCTTRNGCNYLNDAAWDVVDKTESETYYLDMKSYRKSGDKKVPETPYTPSVSLMYAMNEALP